MKKLRTIVSDFFLLKKKEEPFQTVTIDLFDRVRREVNEMSIGQGNNGALDYEVRIVVEVIDQKRFPLDYAALLNLLGALEDLEN